MAEPKPFPSSKVEALTLLYLQNQDLSGKTIEEIVALYNEIYTRASDAFIASARKH